MEMKPEYDMLIAELADEYNAILRRYQVRLTPTNKIIMAAEHIEAYGDAIEQHIKQVSALSRIIAADNK
jgi:HD superfamily phosphodiesterase